MVLLPTYKRRLQAADAIAGVYRDNGTVQTPPMPFAMSFYYPGPSPRRCMIADAGAICEHLRLAEIIRLCRCGDEYAEHDHAAEQSRVR
jgi:hypothetical protein